MGDSEPTISTHLLDTAEGHPAQGVEVTLQRATEAGDVVVGRSITDADGRVRRLLNGPLEEGFYRIEFWIAGPFFHVAQITFYVADTSRSYHVPLIVAPYSLATYRGS